MSDLLSGLFGGGMNPLVLPGSIGADVTGGGLGQPFSFGPSSFDLSSITGALSDNQTATTNRYNQLGLGGSTAETTDLGALAQQANALIGQEQTSDVSNPAINPSLQPTINELIGGGGGGSISGLQSANAGANASNNNLNTLLTNLGFNAGFSGQGGGGGGLGG
jgi:hypothetical protein